MHKSSMETITTPGAIVFMRGVPGRGDTAVGGRRRSRAAKALPRREDGDGRRLKGVSKHRPAP